MNDSPKTMLQYLLDKFHAARQHVVMALVFVTLRIYGKEIAYDDLLAGRFDSRNEDPLILDTAQDIEMLLEMSKEQFADAEKRRGVITDKCKTLLTLGSLLLGLVGLLLPKYLAFDSVWMRFVSMLAIALLFNAIVVLLVFFDIGQEMHVSLNQDDIRLDNINLQKSLINTYLKCSAATENRTDCLAEIYRAAKFCFLSALTIVAGLVLTNLIMANPTEQADRVVREIRSNPALINLLQGPKGDPGVRGDIGPKGDLGPKGDRGDQGAMGKKGDDAKIDEILTRLLSDARFKVELEKAVSTSKTEKKTQP